MMSFVSWVFICKKGCLKNMSGLDVVMVMIWCCLMIIIMCVVCVGWLLKVKRCNGVIVKVMICM